VAWHAAWVLIGQEDTDVATDDVAGPPDSAGSQGVFTRPEDEMEVNREPGKKHPAMAHDPAEPGGRGGFVWLLGWGVAFLLIVAFFMWAYGGGA
jgi:hypothetical protein